LIATFRHIVTSDGTICRNAAITRPRWIRQGGCRTVVRSRDGPTGAGEAGVRRRASTAGLFALGLALAAWLLAGCGERAADSASRAATAGRACQLIEYDVVATAIGTRFDTAGGAQSGETYTCVLGVNGKAYPDLTVAMSPTTISELIFVATVTPNGATPVAELGLTAYQVTLPPVTASDGTASGPRLELGWLSVSKRLMVLRYTFAVTATPAEIEAFAPRLVTLARRVEQTLTAQP
jgi:hypothetical protein